MNCHKLIFPIISLLQLVFCCQSFSQLDSNTMKTINLEFDLSYSRDENLQEFINFGITFVDINTHFLKPLYNFEIIFGLNNAKSILIENIMVGLRFKLELFFNLKLLTDIKSGLAIVKLPDKSEYFCSSSGLSIYLGFMNYFLFTEISYIQTKLYISSPYKFGICYII